MRLGRIIFAAFLCRATGLGPSRADVASQAKWHPIAAAYLFAMFVTELRPIDWPAIEDRFQNAPERFRHGGDRTVYELLGPAGKWAGTDFAGAIREGRAPQMSLERGMEDHRLMDAAYASADAAGSDDPVGSDESAESAGS